MKLQFFCIHLGNSDENSLINEMEQLTTDEQSQSQAEDERDEIVIRIQDDSTTTRGIYILNSIKKQVKL